MDTFKQQIKRIDSEASQISKRYEEIESLVRQSEQTPKAEDINSACKVLSLNMGHLTHQERRQTFEALRIKVHLGNSIKIEGTLPIQAKAEELQLLKQTELLKDTEIPFSLSVTEDSNRVKVRNPVS